MIGMKVTTDLAKVAAALEGRFGPELAQGILAASEVAAGSIRREIANWTSHTDHRKTGALMRSFVPAFKKADGMLVAGAYSNLKYAAIHEDGGVIRAKKRALTIPLTPEAERKRARAWGNKLFIVKRNGRPPFLAEKTAGGIKPQYLLVPSVRITPKHYIAKAAKACQGQVNSIMEQAVEKALAVRGAALTP